VCQIFALKQDFPAFALIRPEPPVMSTLARAIGTDEGGNFAGVQFQLYVFDGADVAIRYAEVLDA
jgi:hypothetical protein